MSNTEPRLVPDLPDRHRERLVLLPYRPERDREALAAAAREDQHMVLLPTHVVMAKGDGRVVGYGSVGAVPMVHVWLDSKRVRARDSALLFRDLERMVGERAGGYIMPCCQESPFTPMMEHKFERLGTTVLWFRRLKGD